MCGWFPSSLLLNYYVRIVYYMNLIENALYMLFPKLFKGVETCLVYCHFMGGSSHLHVVGSLQVCC